MGPSGTAGHHRARTPATRPRAHTHSHSARAHTHSHSALVHTHSHSARAHTHSHSARAHTHSHSALVHTHSHSATRHTHTHSHSATRSHTHTHTATRHTFTHTHTHTQANAKDRIKVDQRHLGCRGAGNAERGGDLEKAGGRAGLRCGQVQCQHQARVGLRLPSPHPSPGCQCQNGLPAPVCAGSWATLSSSVRPLGCCSCFLARRPCCVILFAGGPWPFASGTVGRGGMLRGSEASGSPPPCPAGPAPQPPLEYFVAAGGVAVVAGRQTRRDAAGAVPDEPAAQHCCVARGPVPPGPHHCD